MSLLGVFGLDSEIIDDDEPEAGTTLAAGGSSGEPHDFGIIG